MKKLNFVLRVHKHSSVIQIPINSYFSRGLNSRRWYAYYYMGCENWNREYIKMILER